MPGKVKYQEGTLFLVPLKSSGFALGIVVRTDGKGRVFGYFFGPKLETQTLPPTFDINPTQSIMACRFGDFGLHNAKWTIVGRLANWNRSDWPLPRFSRPHDDPTKVYITEYDDSLNCVSESIVPLASTGELHLVSDSQLGSAIVEARLNDIFLG